MNSTAWADGSWAANSWFDGSWIQSVVDEFASGDAVKKQLLTLFWAARRIFT